MDSGNGQPTPLVALLLVAAIAVVALACSEQRIGPDFSRAESIDDCDEGPGECWLVTVERPMASGSGRLRLAVRAVAPEGPEAERPPLLIIGGGPALSGLSGWRADVENFPGAFVGRTVLFFDQRGVGRSDDLLMCDGATPAVCADEVLSGLSTSFYSSHSLALDLVALRQSLGIERWDIVAHSYGAEVGQYLAAVDPQATRSLILALPTAIDFAQPATDRRVESEAIDQYFSACERDTGCRRVLPDGRRRFAEIRSSLDTSPLIIEGAAQVDGDAATGHLLVAIDDWRTRGDVPLLLVALEERRLDLYPHLFALASGSTGSPAVSEIDEQAAIDRYANWLLVATWTFCEDGLGAVQPAAYGQADWFTDPEPYRSELAELVDECARAGISSDAPEPPALEVPTLVIAGEIDTRASLTEAQRIADLAAGELVVLPWYGHEGTWEDPCPQELMSQFWEEPGPDLDQTCVQELTYDAIYGPTCPTGAYAINPNCN